MTDHDLDRSADEEAGDAPVEAADTGNDEPREEHDEADSAGTTDV